MGFGLGYEESGFNGYKIGLGFGFRIGLDRIGPRSLFVTHG
jgi:hypothetical protein